MNDFEAVLRGDFPRRRLASALAGFVVSAWVFVPVHELLHAAGCLLGGGGVTRLEIDPKFGGALLERVFPFVVSGGEYAGRLSGFDTGGQDWLYALTTFFPYLTTPLGFFVLGWAAARRRPGLFGASVIWAFSPVTGLTGDFYELGSLALFQLWPGPENAHRILVSDDLFRLIEEISVSAGGPGWSLSSAAFAALGELAALLLAGAVVLLSSKTRSSNSKLETPNS